MDADVVVIGAGAAGLAAARSLAHRSFRVVLLEARDRIGGRVLSQALRGAELRAELGAEFIHGKAKLTMSLLREAGIASAATGDESWLCREDGELEPDLQDFAIVARAALGRARSLSEDQSVESYLRGPEHKGALRADAQAAFAFVEGFEAAEPSLASVRAIAQELHSGVDSTSARPLGSYWPMFVSLQHDCAGAGVHIRLSTIARRIVWKHGNVAIDATASSGQATSLCARAAIVTLPAGLLAHLGDESGLTFEPKLPAFKQGALDKIAMGHAVKVALSFGTAFWEHIRGGRYRNGAFFRCVNQSFAVYWTQLPVRSSLIIAWAGGPKAAALSKMPEAMLIERAVDGFGALFGETALARKEFEDGAMHDWDRDRFAQGAYSYVTVGGGAARAALAAPIDGTLFFAGEATSTDGQGGTVNGALETGERAAAQAAGLLHAGAV